MRNDLKIRERSVEKIDPRQDQDLVLALGKADTMLSKLYLNAVGAAAVVPIDLEKWPAQDATSLNRTIRFFELAQVVLDASENPRDKLVSVFTLYSSVEVT